MHRLEEEERNKIYEAIKELYSAEGKDVNCFEVKYEKDGTDYFVYRMVTRYDNSTGIVDYSYKNDYEGDEDTRSRAVIQKWTIDIPKEVMDKAIELCGGEETIINSYALINLLRDNEVEDAEKIGKWFIRHLEIDGLLDKYDEINGTGKPKAKKEKVVDEDTAVVEAENSEYHGGTYDV